MRIGIVGCGRIASPHASALAELPDVSQVMVFDRETAAATALAGRGVKFRVARNLAEIAEQCMGFVVCTPNDMHRHVIASVLAHRPRPFLCEKPFTASLKQAEMIGAEAPTGSAIAFNYRFNPAMAAIQANLAGGVWGSLHFFSAEFNKGSALNRTAPAWRDDRVQGKTGGALGDLGSHLIDLFHWMSGETIELTSVRALIGSRMRRADDHAILTGVGSSGTPFRIRQSKTEEPSRRGLRLEMVLERAEVSWTSVDPQHIRVVRAESVDIEAIPVPFDPELPRVDGEVPFWLESIARLDGAWVKSLLGTTIDAVPRLDEAIEVHRVIDRSIAEGGTR